MKISVITVALNAEKTISDALISVSSQTYQNIEHLLIDGGSIDGTLAVVQKHGKHLEKYISEPDNGIYDAMNRGAKISTGEVLGFLNSDDFYAHQDVLERVAFVFRREPVDVCYGDLQYVDRYDPRVVLRHWKAGSFATGKFAKGWAPPHPTFFVRRSVFEAVGGFNTNYKLAADNDLMMRILECKKSKSSYIPEVLVKMRAGGATNKSIKNILSGNLEILKALNENGIKNNIVSYICNKIALKMSQRIAGFRSCSVG